MLQHSQDPVLDRVFLALADSTRRAMIEQLSAGPRSISELAAPHDVTLTAIGQHVATLESAGLVSSAKVGRVRTVTLETKALARAERWLVTHQKRWAMRLDRLGALLAEDDDAPTPTRRGAKVTKK